MVPFVAGRNRVSRLKQVVLPAPLGPISAWMVPRTTRRSTRLTAMNPRNSLDSPRVSRMTSGSGTRLLSRKAARRASTGALERCDPGAASPAFRLTYPRGENAYDRFHPFPLSFRAARGRRRLGAAAAGRQSRQPALDEGEGQANLRRPELHHQPAGQSGGAGQPAQSAEQGRRSRPDHRHDGQGPDVRHGPRHDEEREAETKPAEAPHVEPPQERDV